MRNKGYRIEGGVEVKEVIYGIHLSDKIQLAVCGTALMGKSLRISYRNFSIDL